jgi:ATP-dependent Lhr-like helicase
VAENMLDRYGVITRGSAISEQIPGGFPALQPVLRGAASATAAVVSAGCCASSRSRSMVTASANCVPPALGARVVIAAGKLALYLPQGGKDLLLFTDDDAQQGKASMAQHAE